MKPISKELLAKYREMEAKQHELKHSAYKLLCHPETTKEQLWKLREMVLKAVTSWDHVQAMLREAYPTKDRPNRWKQLPWDR